MKPTGKSILEIGDKVIPSPWGKRIDFIIGEVFEIELPDAIYIIADGDDDKLLCVSAGQVQVVEI